MDGFVVPTCRMDPNGLKNILPKLLPQTKPFNQYDPNEENFFTPINLLIPIIKKKISEIRRRVDHLEFVKAQYEAIEERLEVLEILMEKLQVSVDATVDYYNSE